MSHDLIADAMSDVLGASGCARLHALIAIGLESASADPGELARHLSGAGDLVAAAEPYARAGKAWTGSRTAWRSPPPTGDWKLNHPATRLLRCWRFELRRGSAGVRSRRPDSTCGRRSEPGPPGSQRALTLVRLAMLTSEAQDYVHASELAELALLEAGDEPGARAEALLTAANFDLNLGRPESVIRRED